MAAKLSAATTWGDVELVRRVLRTSYVVKEVKRLPCDLHCTLRNASCLRNVSFSS